MSNLYEPHVRDEAGRNGFAMKRRFGFDGKWNGGFVLTDGNGNGVVRATPATLEEAQAFLERAGQA